MTDGMRPPANCTFSENDWQLLASFWHPIAFAAEIGLEPVAVRLLDVDLMVIRIREGFVVTRDRCPHRGSKLSNGQISEDRIVCAYHGFEYGFDGKCLRVPSAPQGYKIPRKLCLETCPVEERYGLVWACLKGEAINPLPEWPIFQDPNVQKAKLDVVLNTGAGRQVENFCDTAHFSYTHKGTFGWIERPEVPDYDVETREYGLSYTAAIPQQDGSLFFAEPEHVEVLSDYDITFPYAAQLISHFPRGDEHVYDIASPISAGKCHMFMLKTRDHDLGDPSDEWIGFEDKVNEEDRIMVEAQQPLELPVKNSPLEVHTPADKFSMTYRRMWRKLGLEGSSP